MVIARVAPGAKFSSLTTTTLRRLYSTVVSSPNNSNNETSKTETRSKWRSSERQSSGHATNQSPSAAKKTQSLTPKTRLMMVPLHAKKFVTNNGRLKTTPENWAFLQENLIEYDNSTVTKLNLGPENSRIISNFTTRVYFSPDHILHPHHLQYLDPRDHPLGESFRMKYKKKVQEEPLWLIMMDQNDDVGLVRTMAKRRLTAAFWSSMKDLGYDRFPEPGAPRIKGTVLVKIGSAKAAANFPASRFGEAVAKSVVERRS